DRRAAPVRLSRDARARRIRGARRRRAPREGKRSDQGDRRQSRNAWCRSRGARGRISYRRGNGAAPRRDLDAGRSSDRDVVRDTRRAARQRDRHRRSAVRRRVVPGFLDRAGPGAAMTRQTVIAIDGPAASGKSSTAQWVAQRLGFCHVDSGALYRAATAARLRDTGGDDPERWTEADVLNAARRRVALVPQNNLFVPQLDGAFAEEELRGSQVTQQVSRVAKMQGVRAWVNQQVRETAERKPVVVDGRDIGTTVFPDADLKVFLVADPWERARRRLVQQLQRSPSD